MTHQQLSQYIIRKLQQVSEKYSDSRSQHLYEIGILIGLLASLSLRDSYNFDLIRDQFDKIIDNE